MNDDSDVKQAAVQYIRHGWRVVPIPHKEKGPRTPQWQNLRLAEEQVADYFPKPSNVGVLLGELSGGLVDIDLDAPEAQRVAGKILPPTELVFGHGSVSQSISYMKQLRFLPQNGFRMLMEKCW